MTFIPLHYIYNGLWTLAGIIVLVLLYHTPQVLKLRIRFHGRPAALRRAIRKANKLNKENGKRYRVFFLGMRYRVYDRLTIKGYKKAGVFNRYINSTTIDQTKFYDTNDFEPCTSQKTS